MSTALAAPQRTTPEAQPFKFLNYYVEQDETRYGGRARDIREVVTRITYDTTLILYGRSGLGKTSLLLAGVFPELKRQSFLPIYIRTLQAPLEDLSAAVALAIDPRQASDVEHLDAAVRLAGAER